MIIPVGWFPDGRLLSERLENNDFVDSDCGKPLGGMIVDPRVMEVWGGRETDGSPSDGIASEGDANGGIEKEGIKKEPAEGEGDAIDGIEKEGIERGRIGDSVGEPASGVGAVAVTDAVCNAIAAK